MAAVEVSDGTATCKGQQDDRGNHIIAHRDSIDVFSEKKKVSLIPFRPWQPEAVQMRSPPHMSSPP